MFAHFYLFTTNYYNPNQKQKMIEQFLQRKLAGLIDQYIEFQKLNVLNAEGLSLKNSKIKPKFIEVLSQSLQMPLQLISGSINSLTLNRPWEKLFFFNSPVSICVQDVHIRTKLPGSLQESYLLRRKQHLLERLTQGLFNPLEAALHRKHSFLNKKLKQYLLNTIILNLRNFCLQIDVDLKHRVTLVLRIESLTLRKQQKRINESQRVHLQLRGVGLYYRAQGFHEIEFLAPTQIIFEREKRQLQGQKKWSSAKKLHIQNLQINLNNVNYGDIARIFFLLKWHNSFNSLPYDTWKLRPFVLSECRPYQKLQYCANLLLNSLKQQSYRLQLIKRRQYIDLYYPSLADPQKFSPQNKSKLLQMEKCMPIWRITAYRLFCINLLESRIISKKQRQQQQQEKIQQNSWWFSNWSATQSNRDELQQQFLKKLSSIDALPDEIQTQLYVTIDRLKIKLSIFTQSIQPFILLVGTDCSFRYTTLPMEKTWWIDFQIVRCKIEYEKYLGHCDRYRNFISECKEHLNISRILQSNSSEMNEQQQQDQFDQIGKFLEVNFGHDSKNIIINLLPFDIFLNYDVIEKFSILLNVQSLSKLSRLDKIQQNFIDQINPWQMVERQKQKIVQLKRSQNQSIRNSLSLSHKDSIQSGQDYNQLQQQNSFKFWKENMQITLKTTFNFIIPMDLHNNNSAQLVIQVGQAILTKKKTINIIQLKDVIKNIIIRWYQSSSQFFSTKNGTTYNNQKIQYKWYILKT